MTVRASIPALITALSDPNTRVGRDAARSLGQMGPVAREAVPVLRKLQNDDNERVREAATKSLQIIDPAAPRTGKG
jgi:HEAT repeat protein